MTQHLVFSTQHYNSAMPIQKRLSSILPLVTVLLLTTVIFLPVLYHWRDTGDFNPHTVYIDRILVGDNAVFYETPNFLYHLGILGLHAIFPAANITALVVIVSLAWYLLLAATVYRLSLRSLLISINEETNRFSVPLRLVSVAIITTLALLVATPITLLTPDNQYFGYMTPYVYHNPTMIPLRPLSLILFVISMWVFGKIISNPNSEQHPSGNSVPPLYVWRGGWEVQLLYILLTALLTLACILAKPSFVMILLPSLALATLWRMIFRKPIHWGLLLGGIVIPAVGLLGYQALTWTDGGMAFSPFEVFRLWDYHYDPNSSANLVLKLILSLLFPIVVYVAYFPRARRDLTLNLAWLCALAGTAFAYLFIDTGDPVAGNLTWNGQIGVFIIYIVSMLFLLRENRAFIAGEAAAFPRRLGISVFIFGLHLISGITWYWLHLTGIWPDIIYGIW